MISAKDVPLLQQLVLAGNISPGACTECTLESPASNPDKATIDFLGYFFPYASSKITDIYMLTLQ